MKRIQQFYYAFMFCLWAKGFRASWCYAEGLRDVRPPMALPFPLIVLYLVAGLVSLLILFLLWWYFKKRRGAPRKAVEPPPPPPWEIAYQRLTQLQQDNLPSQGKIKEFYTRLSDIVRHYMEGRFQINAPDMTTEEFLYSLKNNPILKASHQESLEKFLSCCDMVKFAKYGSNNNEVEQSFLMARRLVDETKLQKEGDKETS